MLDYTLLDSNFCFAKLILLVDSITNSEIICIQFEINSSKLAQLKTSNSGWIKLRTTSISNITVDFGTPILLLEMQIVFIECQTSLCTSNPICRKLLKLAVTTCQTSVIQMYDFAFALAILTIIHLNLKSYFRRVPKKGMCNFWLSEASS